jgi:hypothetical protein
MNINEAGNGQPVTFGILHPRRDFFGTNYTIKIYDRE